MTTHEPEVRRVSDSGLISYGAVAYRRSSKHPNSPWVMFVYWVLIRQRKRLDRRTG